MKSHTHLHPWIKNFPQILELDKIQIELQTAQVRFAVDPAIINLRIGIMGQVKAGKSTFLNALLFQGRPVLPEAATPKTANLTRITWGEDYRLDVEFYTRQEWADITAQSHQSDDDERTKVAQELVKMVHDSGVDPQSCLAQDDQQPQAFHADDLDGLMALLNDYTGNNGAYTPLVKMTHLYLPDEALRGLDVIDTPGMNDPVLSRTIKTKDYMAQCDVVFFLSRCSQFLDQSDLDLLGEQLPSKGIKRMVLVAGQLDAAVLDDGFDRDSLATTLDNLRTRLGRRAAQELEKLAAQHEHHPDHAPIAALLRTLKTPTFASTFAYGFAHWPQAQWGRSMQHTHAELQELAQSSWNMPQGLSNDDWLRMAGFDALQNAYAQARDDKRALLAERKDSLERDAQREVQKALIELEQAVTERLSTLQTKDLAQLEHQQKLLQQRLSGIADRLGDILSSAQTQAREKAAAILSSLRKDMAAYGQLKTRQGAETHEDSYEVDDSTWYKPWTWGDTRTVHTTYTVNYDYLSAADAVEQLSHYEHECATSIEAEFSRIVSPREIKAALRKGLVQELSRYEQEFDPLQFRQTLDNALQQLTIPALQLPVGNNTDALAREFSGQIRADSDMQRLRAALQAGLQKVYQRLTATLKPQTDHLLSSLESVEKSLDSTLSASLNEELEALRNDFKVKAEQIASYRTLLSHVQAEQTAH